MFVQDVSNTYDDATNLVLGKCVMNKKSQYTKPLVKDYFIMTIQTITGRVQRASYQMVAIPDNWEVFPVTVYEKLGQASTGK